MKNLFNQVLTVVEQFTPSANPAAAKSPESAETDTPPPETATRHSSLELQTPSPVLAQLLALVYPLAALVGVVVMVRWIGPSGWLFLVAILALILVWFNRPRIR